MVCVAHQNTAWSREPHCPPRTCSGPPALTLDEARYLLVLQVRLQTREDRTHIHNPTYTILKPKSAEKLLSGLVFFFPHNFLAAFLT